MKIQDLSQATGVSAKTIRFYEESGVLPPPPRKPNGYRDYDQADVDRLQLVAGARRLDLSLDDIQEILAMRDRREAPCRTLLERLQTKVDEVAERIATLRALKQSFVICILWNLNSLLMMWTARIVFVTWSVKNRYWLIWKIKNGKTSD